MLVALGSGNVIAQVQKVVDVVLEPETMSVAEGETFTLTIKVIPNGQQVAGMDTFIDFDPAHLQVVGEIEAGSTFPTLLATAVDNDGGKLTYSAGIELGTASPTTDFTMASITFRAISSGSTSVTFHTSGLRKTNAAFGAFADPVLRSLRGAGIGIGVTPTPVPVVTIQYTPTPPPSEPTPPPSETTPPPAETTPPPAETTPPPAETTPPPVEPAIKTPASAEPTPRPTPTPAPTPTPTAPAETPAPTSEPSTGIAWWIWPIVGVVVVGVGSYFVVRASAR